ncbi:MAG: NADH-quinone oxidoreductase subunit NuoK [Bacteroidetes bacterium]|nr:NADH-quinone oxidoreductase subunit NuoK [Bacteroidota bacterium]
MTLTPYWFFVLSAFLFSTGVYLAVTRRHAVAVLLGTELVINAGILNLVAFQQLYPERMDGQMTALFAMIAAAAGAAVALAIILNLYRNFRSGNTPDSEELKG